MSGIIATVMARVRVATVVASMVALSMSGMAGQGATRPPAVRLDPVSAILDAFTTHEVVALSEGPHGNTAGHAFRLALVRDPRFAATVNDIIVESGSAPAPSRRPSGTGRSSRSSFAPCAHSTRRSLPRADCVS